MNNLKVCFCCTTSYSIFLSVILAKTKYKKSDNTIILSDLLPDCNEIYNRIKKSDIFDKVYLIKEKKIMDNHVDKNIIDKKLKEIDIDSYNIVHIYTFGSIYSQEIYYNYKGKVIITEEGTSTYIIEEYDVWKKLLSKDRINEILVFEPRLYTGNEYKDKLSKIDINQIIEDRNEFSKLVNILNNIFNYNSENEDIDIIYFDQYLSRNLELEEVAFFETLYKNIGDIKIKIKKHPLFPNDSKFNKYKDANFIKCQNNMPWELIYFNMVLKNNNKEKLILLTINSASVFTIKTIFQNSILNRSIQIEIILLDKILKEDNNSMLKFISKYEEIYGELNKPQSFNELIEIIKEFKIETKNKVVELPILSMKEKSTIEKIMKDSYISLEFDSLHLMYLRLAILKEILKDKNNVLIWGAGNGGNIASETLYAIKKDINIVGYIDKFKNGQFNDKLIYKPEEIITSKYDYIIIATSTGRYDAEKKLDEIGLEKFEEYCYLLLY